MYFNVSFIFLLKYFFRNEILSDFIFENIKYILIAISTISSLILLILILFVSLKNPGYYKPNDSEEVDLKDNQYILINY